MAFDFLNDVPWETLGAVGTLAGRAGGLYNMFRSQNPYKDIPALQEMVNNAAASREYLNASVNPQHPFFQNLQAIYNQQLREQAANSVREMFTQARRGQASGQSGLLVNPERRDETSAKALAQAFMGARMKSQEMARQALENAAGGFAKLNYSMAQPAQIQGEYAGANRANRLQGFQGLSNLFTGINLPRATSNKPQDQSSPSGLGGTPSSHLVNEREYY